MNQLINNLTSEDPILPQIAGRHYGQYISNIRVHEELPGKLDQVQVPGPGDSDFVCQEWDPTHLASNQLPKGCGCWPTL